MHGTAPLVRSPVSSTGPRPLTAFSVSGSPQTFQTAGSAAASAATSLVSQPPSNFAQVTPNIYRGGHPDDSALQFLKNLGIKTIVDLEIDDLVEATASDIDQEMKGAAALGIREIREPMSAFSLAASGSFNEEINQIITLLADPSQGPYYVHCAHGQDRTGLVIGLERVFDQAWTPAAAWREMLAHGFHNYFLGLDSYFQRKTSWTGGFSSGTWQCRFPDGTYCGGDGVNLDWNALYICSSGTLSVLQVCSAGCRINGGSADRCN